MSDVFHVHDGLVIYEDRSNGPAETHRTYFERTVGVEARYDERDDEQSQRHEALRLSALDTTPVESERTGFVRYRQKKCAARRTLHNSLR